jgi:uncharacterized membrane protein YkvA (DUF1232 family)
MKDYEEYLTETLSGYQEERQELVAQAPAFFRLLSNILDDPNLPGRLRPLVLAGIAYFALATDIIPEDLVGPNGLIDDIFLAAFICARIRQALGSAEILTENWDGTGDVLALIANILERETELVGDQRELILWYIGYEHLEH